MKSYLVIAAVALVAVAITWRTPSLRTIVFGA